MEAEKANSRANYIAVNSDRRLTYAFLSRVYEREMTEDLLKQLSKEDGLTLKWVSSGDQGKELAEGFEMLRGYLQRLPGRDLKEVRLELAVEYANLFLGIKGKPPHPSESVYRSKAQLKFQEFRDQVMAAYWSAGVDKVKEFTEPEDHIAIELQFMEYLCRKTVDALERNQTKEARKWLEAQKAFVDDHLAQWVPQLTRDILETATTDFYKGAAYVTDAFVKSDRMTIGHMIGKAGLSA